MREVVVVGAGISGLVAAWRLQCAGVKVVVLEQESRVGGRVHTATVNGCRVELGANFITDAYQVIPGLAANLGIELVPVSARNAICIDGKLRPFRADAPLSAFRSGILTPMKALTQVPGLARMLAECRGRRPRNPRDWIEFDSMTATEWAQNLGLTYMTERSWRPAFNGFYFQEAADTSAAAVAATLSHGFSQKTLTAVGGLSSITNALAIRLDVRKNVTVTSVHEESDRVIIQTSAGQMEADDVIVATQAPTLARLTNLNEYEEAVANVGYSTGLLVALSMKRHLRMGELGGAYGILFHPNEAPFSSLCVASRAGHASGQGDVVTCMLNSASAQMLAERTGVEIIDWARKALLSWEPALERAVVPGTKQHLVERIPNAMPLSPPGRVASIVAYQEHAKKRRVLLASDAISWPWTDSAAVAGRWAADQILDHYFLNQTDSSVS